MGGKIDPRMGPFAAPLHKENMRRHLFGFSNYYVHEYYGFGSFCDITFPSKFSTPLDYPDEHLCAAPIPHRAAWLSGITH